MFHLFRNLYCVCSYLIINLVGETRHNEAFIVIAGRVQKRKKKTSGQKELFTCNGTFSDDCKQHSGVIQLEVRMDF